MTSAGRATGTNASSVARDGQFPIQQSETYKGRNASQGQFTITQNLPMHINEHSEFDYQEQRARLEHDRARPRTAKVPGFVNNLRQFSAI